MPRTARGVNDLKIKNRCPRVFGVIGNCLHENGFKCRFDKLVYKCRWGIVGTGKLSLGTFSLGFFVIFIADKPKSPGYGVNIHDRLKFKQAFVDRTEFFSVHVPVVHASEHGV